MFVLSVDLRIKPENVESFIAKAVENAADSRKEPGCRQFDVLVDPKDRTQGMLYEVYADEKAFDAHQQTAHFKKYIAEAGPPPPSRPPPPLERPPPHAAGAEPAPPPRGLLRPPPRAHLLPRE